MRTPRLVLPGGLLLLALGLVPATVLAQTGAASVTGLVTDSTGAAIPGATVTATNQATNVAYTAVSNEAGNYTVTSVPVNAVEPGSAPGGTTTSPRTSAPPGGTLD